MVEILLNQNMCMYVMIVCGCIGLIGRIVMSGYLAGLAKAAEHMGAARKKPLVEMRKRYEDTASLDVSIHDSAAFVDKYIDRLRLGFIPVRVWNGFVKNMGIAAFGTGIFAAAYQYYVVGDNAEAVKLLGCGLAVCMVIVAVHNQWNCEWHMRTLRDSVRSYIGNSLANRLKKEGEKQMRQESVEAAAACSGAVGSDSGNTTPKTAKEEKQGKKSDYDALLDGIMKKILADG